MSNELREFCAICKTEIMYENPEEFDPVCMDEDTGDVHCEGCCICGEKEVN